MNRNEGQWPDQETINKAMDQRPENWNRMTDEDIDEMFEAHKKDVKDV